MNKRLYIWAGLGFLFIVAAIYFLFIFKKAPSALKPSQSEGEVQQISDLKLKERPYVTLTPTSDGAEIVISIENMSAFDRIEYELTYLSDNPQIPGDKIQRGATGTDVATGDAKYKKSILLGTASRGVRSPDTGITDGKLTMHLMKGETEYQSETAWTLTQIGQGYQVVKDTLGNFTIEIPSLGKSYWAILADTVGAGLNPSDFKIDEVTLPVYGVFSIAPKFTSMADLSIKTEAKDPVLYSYNHQDQTWQKLEAKFDPGENTLTAQVSSLATFVVVSK